MKSGKQTVKSGKQDQSQHQLYLMGITYFQRKSPIMVRSPVQLDNLERLKKEKGWKTVNRQLQRVQSDYLTVENQASWWECKMTRSANINAFEE